MSTLIYSEVDQTRRYRLPTGDTVVGRAVTCDLVINDASISRRHAQFSVTGDACVESDLGSSNGISWKQ